MSIDLIKMYAKALGLCGTVNQLFYYKKNSSY